MIDEEDGVIRNGKADGIRGGGKIWRGGKKRE